MHPVVHAFGAEVSAYRLFTIVALVAAVVAVWVVAGRRGVRRRDRVVFLAVTLPSALVGARLFAAATAADPFWGGLGDVAELRFGNMALFGGLAGATLGGLVASRWTKQQPERLADQAAPAIGIGIVALRFGCLLAGCCFGTETSVPWAITYPVGSLAHGYQRLGSVFSPFADPSPVHPIPVYEMLAAGLLTLVVLRILERGARDGTAFAVMVGGYAIVRLLVHPLRVAEPGVTPAWFDPALYLLVLAGAACWLAVGLVRMRRLGDVFA